MISFRSALPVLLAASLAFALAACSKPDAATGGSEDGGKVLHFGNGAEPQDLDPLMLTGVIEHRLSLALFEGLVSEDPQLNLIPGAAKSWEVSEDRLVYTFHLQDEGRWSNGDPVTTADFIGAFQRMLTPSLAAEYAYMLFCVAGAEDYYKGRITDFRQTGFKALDEHTLQLTLAQPTPYLLHALNHYAWYPVPIKVVEQFGGLERRGTRWTRAENFVGNGPFRLKEWRPNQKMIVERSPTYWDRANVKLDEIHFYPIESSETEERMFRTGQLHITNEMPLSKIPVYQRDRPEELRIDPYNGVYFYRFNVKRKPFDDPRVRRALALAVDRESLVRNVTLAGEEPAYNLVPPGMPGYVSRHRLQGDLAEARRLLADAGYPEGRGFPRVELLYNTLEKNRTIAEAVQQMWRRNLGIDIGIYNQEWKVYLDSQDTQNFDLQRAGWIADYVDPHVFIDLWTSDSLNNDTGWSNPNYDRLFRQALAAKDDAGRFAIYQQMEKILVDELPVIPLFFYNRARLVSPRTNFFTTPLDNFPMKFIELN